MALKSYTLWSNAQHVSAPTTTILLTTAGTFHDFNYFSHMICTLWGWKTRSLPQSGSQWLVYQHRYGNPHFKKRCSKQSYVCRQCFVNNSNSSNMDILRAELWRRKWYTVFLKHMRMIFVLKVSVLSFTVLIRVAFLIFSFRWSSVNHDY